MASSSSSAIPTMKKYDVFISFRGKDTRNNFTSHLYAALLRKNIKAYIDDMLNRGDEISPALKKAIEESRLSVIIFSENYASSSWCLDELVHILECRKTKGQLVIPVFHNLDPSHVRRQSGSYADALAVLEERFSERLEKVHQWRATLTTAADLPGWNSIITRPESKLVNEIVEDILKKLNRVPSSNEFKGLVGISERIQQIETLLDVGSESVRFVGIWGMAGIGKTTLASVVFEQLAYKFEGCCFLFDIREESKRQGIRHLRDKLFSELLEEDIHSIACFGSSFTETRLRSKTVLIVLDDVNDPEQLELLVGDHDRFGPGSRIIITTRDVQVLRSIGADGVYMIEELNDDEALQLFHSVALKKIHSSTSRTELSKAVIDNDGHIPLALKETYFPTGYTKLSKAAINYAGGIPLALKVLASFLSSKSPETWENVFDKLEKLSNNKIQGVLKTSYDELYDNQRSVFLDIACFFKREDRDYVERILNCKSELDDLIDKSLLTITHDNKLWMHDAIQEMGRDIVQKDSVKEPGRRTRLWNAQDVYHVLRNNTGTEAVEGIILDMSKTKDINFSPLVFQKMHNLRILKIYNSPRGDRESNVWPYEDFQSVSDKLTYLQWDGFCCRFLPPNFSPENLVELIMPDSQLKQLWNGVQRLGSLKKIDLSRCYSLNEMPDLSLATNLTNLTLEGCRSIKEFPELPRNVKSLNLSKTTIKEVPSSIERISSLEVFDLSDCRNLESLPTSICKLKSLKSLYLSGSTNFRNFPVILEPMERLAELELDRTAIEGLHPSVENLVGLESLHLELCQNLEFVPDSIYNISSLEYVSLWRCTKLKSSPELPEDSSQRASTSGPVVPKIESSTALVQRWDPFQQLFAPSQGIYSRRYNYLKRVPAETAPLSSRRYSDLIILEPKIVMHQKDQHPLTSSQKH